jgi:selenocysteine-specific elongation factor
MLAGVGAVDACLFVVAATEGWKPQSEEHLRILSLLGVTAGVVALTKAGLADDDTLELARLDVEDRVAGTFLADAEVVAVDALTGTGVDDLRAALDRLVAATPVAVDRGRPRLWVDRSFAAKGSGTVVTGTLTGGRIAVDDELDLLPAGRRARVRALQSHSSPLVSAAPGRRLAVNLSGVAHTEVVRGDVLVRAAQWAPSRMVDASLSVLAGLDHEVTRRGAYALYVGSAEHPVKVRVLGPDALAPGDQGLVRLHLPVALPLLPGDRYVLRESGRGETIGGGEILDVAPVLPATRARPDRRVERVVQERAWVDAGDLALLTGVAVAPTVGRWVVAPAVRADAERRLAQAGEAAGAEGGDLAARDERDRAVLATLPEVRIDGGRARAAATAAPEAAGHPYVEALQASPFAPPTPEEAGVARSEVRDLIRSGAVVERDGMHFAASAVAEAARVVAGVLAAEPDGATASRLREALGTSRKYALPLLNLLDAEGVTRRRGDLRIPGPRLPR